MSTFSYQNIILAILLVFLNFSLSVYGAEKFLINSDHSSIRFSIPFLAISKVEGGFDSFKGSFERNSQGPSSIQITIDASSINTNNKRRDKHLRKSDFFHVQKFPLIKFDSTKVEKIQENTHKVVGQLEVMGKIYEQEFLLEFLDQKDDTWENQNYFYQFKGEINRKKLGLSWNKTLKDGGLLIGEQVQINGVIQAQPIGKKTAYSKFLIPDNESIRSREKLFRGEVSKQEITKAQEQNIETTPNQIKSAPTFKTDAIINKTSNKTGSNPIYKKDNYLLQSFSILVVGFYGFLGAISCALLVQVGFRKRKLEKRRIREFFKESMVDTFSILAIVPYAFAMWVFLFNK